MLLRPRPCQLGNMRRRPDLCIETISRQHSQCGGAAAALPLHLHWDLLGLSLALWMVDLNIDKHLQHYSFYPVLTTTSRKTWLYAWSGLKFLAQKLDVEFFVLSDIDGTFPGVSYCCPPRYFDVRTSWHQAGTLAPVWVSCEYPWSQSLAILRSPTLLTGQLSAKATVSWAS